ncbi:hypothetical protein HMPREF0220_3476 [Clostridioides difficile NAP08]|uniref:Uncharacterized protein n=1 Tax=Clostridioides difficile NAP08 TaxID=525259 RepID=D5Q992_CLODI|nr:hypothetical protein HMPREF0220_3476 [Clostridioides difficile NAP08]
MLDIEINNKIIPLVPSKKDVFSIVSKLLNVLKLYLNDKSNN